MLPLLDQSEVISNFFYKCKKVNSIFLHEFKFVSAI